jgi:HEXXH motif-containing protein
MKDRRLSTLTRGDLAALASGGDGESAALATLCKGQVGKHKLLLRGVVRLGGAAMPSAAADLEERYRLLGTLEQYAPEAVATLLRHPQVGAWAAHCLRRLSRRDPSVADDLDYLGAVAAAAAIRAGHPCTLVLPLRAGTLMLPTLGLARLSDARKAVVTVSGPGQATILAGKSVVKVPADPHGDAPGWEGLRRLSFGSRTVFLDDLDPYREYGECVLVERLSAAEVTRWRRALTEAWQLLTDYHPEYARTLGAGVASLIPVDLGADEKSISATSSDAFAAIAASAPADGVTLALALIHEFQHAKLCALIDLRPLFNRDAKTLFYAPWRPDPRPVGGLLHGIYAHMGVSDFWRAHRRVACPSERLVAEIEFTRWLYQALGSATRLQDHKDLTAEGHWFLSHIINRLTEWVTEPVSDHARELAETAAADHLASWRMRNVIPDPGDVALLAQAWLTGRAPHGTVHTRLRPLADGSTRCVRSDLLYLKLRAPDQFDRETANSRDDPDVAYARGDFRGAARGYRAQIAGSAEDSPVDRRAWSGLSLVSGPDSALRKYPEVVQAVYDKLGHLTESPPDPLSLANWLRPVAANDSGFQV